MMKLLNLFKKKVRAKMQSKKSSKEDISDKIPELTIIMGGVCSGKTTLRKNEYANGYVNIDAGDIFIDLSSGEYFDFPSHLEENMNQIGLNKMRESILDKKNIVIEIIGAEYETVKELIDLSEKINYSS